MITFVEKLQNVLNPISAKFASNKYLASLRGVMSVIPIMIIGSVFSLLKALPINAYLNFLKISHLDNVLNIGYEMTMGCLALYVTIAVARELAHQLKQDAFVSGLFSVMVFLFFTPLLAQKGGTFTISMDYLGTAGMLSAMIIALVTTRFYAFLMDKHLQIKMPDSVPPMVKMSFAALIPAIIIAACAALLTYLMQLTPYGNVNVALYKILQTPLQGFTGNYWSFLVLTILSSLFWFCGVHGGSVVNSVMMPTLIALSTANLDAVQSGHSAHNIINLAFMIFSSIGGDGCTLGLVFIMFFFAKSKQYRALSKALLPVGLFNINEPSIFGVPIALNPIMFIPFVLTPAVDVTIAYLATKFGLLSVTAGYMLPQEMPYIIKLFIQCGWSGIVWGLILLFVSALIYFPFFKVLDNQALTQEHGSAATAA
ncbi:PTS sugar transporter subunit IIC [Lacticaseibacillus sp. 866-1]|uniref:PTS sugar transporter subunit IIC n=1 Tax=Lacticaseibacillus sp. 866-1 TaxID=2799576 RepID=UPI0019457A24|nr:PTS transporter subunit EIIC [Lacticaseibacillus sp. 866-1]